MSNYDLTCRLICACQVIIITHYSLIIILERISECQQQLVAIIFHADTISYIIILGI